MSEPASPNLETIPAQPSTATPPRNLPRVRLPFAGLVVFWALTLIMGAITKPYFVSFMFAMISTTLITFLFLGWWWFNRCLRFWEKSVGFVLIIGEGWLISRFTHPSINLFAIFLVGLPIVITVIVAWLFVARKFPSLWPRVGFLLLVTVVWGSFLLFRTEGAYANLKTATHWRWTPTAEQRFLAGSGSSSNPAGPANAIQPKSDTAGTNDWIAFRGPARDGVITGTSIATNWAADRPSLLWKHGVGPAWSSVIIVRGRLYTQEQRGDKETVVCYDALNGGQIWVHEDTARFDETMSGPGPRATPTFANGRLYTLGGTGILNCLDPDTGKAAWTRDIKDASGAKTPMWAFSSSPLVTDDLVIVYAGGDTGKGLVAYKAQSGDLAWTAPAGMMSYGSAQLTTLAGVQQCLMLHDGGLTSFDVATGKKLWEAGSPSKTAPRSSQPRLLEGNKLLIAASGSLGCALIELSRSGEQWTATTKWESKDLKPEFPDFVVHNGYAYGFDIGIFCCLNLADGKRTWKEGRYGRGEVMLLRDQGLLLVSSETGELILLAADPKEHRELGRFPAIEGKTWNHPVVLNDRVYLRNAQEMACYSLSGRSGIASR